MFTVTDLLLITDEWTLAAYSDPASLSTSQKHVLALSNTLGEELLAADTIVNGPQGLLAGKKAVVITSRGGSYRAGTPTVQYDDQQPYLRHILAFVGLTDATFIHAENQKPRELGESSRAAAIAQIQEAAVEQTAAAAMQ